MNGQVFLENGSRVDFLHPVLLSPKLVDGVLLSPRGFIKVKDACSCLVFHHMKWGSTGYGAKNTRVLHKWHPKSVLRRAGIR